VNMFSAVLDQAYVPTSSSGAITFATSLQWPFQVTGETLGTLPSGFTVFSALTETTPTGSCGTTVNSSCYQTFTFGVTPASGTCTLTGSYPITFTVECRGPPGACPLDSNTNSASLTLLLTSADFCATLTTGVTVDASLASYQDATWQTEKADFLITQTAHFLLSTSSPQATVSGATILSIAVIDNTATSTTVYTSGGGRNSTIISLVTSNLPSASDAAFDIDFSADFFDVPTDKYAIFSFQVEVEVTIAGITKKRFALAVQPTATQAAKAQVQLQPAVATTTTSDAVTTCVGFALAGSLLFFSMLM